MTNILSNVYSLPWLKYFQIKLCKLICSALNIMLWFFIQIYTTNIWIQFVFFLLINVFISLGGLENI